MNQPIKNFHKDDISLALTKHFVKVVEGYAEKHDKFIGDILQYLGPTSSSHFSKMKNQQGRYVGAEMLALAHLNLGIDGNDLLRFEDVKVDKSITNHGHASGHGSIFMNSGDNVTQIANQKNYGVKESVLNKIIDKIGNKEDRELVRNTMDRVSETIDDLKKTVDALNEQLRVEKEMTKAKERVIESREREIESYQITISNQQEMIKMMSSHTTEKKPINKKKR